MKKVICMIMVFVMMIMLCVSALAAKSIPEYWLPALEQGAMEINMAMAQAGREKSAFLFYSDAHWNYSSRMAPRLLKYLYDYTGMTKTFFGGDIVATEGEDYETMAYLWEWRAQVKELPNHHSVVGNHDDGNSTNNLFTEEYVYAYLLAPEETPDVVSGEGLYYYIDSPTEKTRYLFLDTAYRYVFEDEKQQEFVKKALISTPDGWHIVALAHIWYSDNAVSEDGTVTGDLAYGGKYLLRVFDEYNRREGDFTYCGGRVEFCIGGHTHWDYDGFSEGGIPVILVETASSVVRSGLESVTETTSESAVNGVIADYEAGKVTIVRVGRGESRTVPLSKPE